jgi:uncharacterized protein
MTMTWESNLERVGGQLVPHAVKFARDLREAGVRVTASQTQTFTQALTVISVMDARAFKDTARTCLVTRREDLEHFEMVFKKFWIDLGMGGIPDELINRVGVPPKRNQARPAEVRETSSEKRQENPDAKPEKLSDRAFTYSSEEVLKNKRFDHMNELEIQTARRVMQGFQWQVGMRRTRRFKAASRGEKLDWRGSLRASFKTGGEWLKLEWKERKTKPRPLIVIADVSGSMERYARMLLHFLHVVTQVAIRGEKRKVETFVFGTRLSRISKLLERRDVDTAVDDVGKTVRDWSGGTRIGESLNTFNRIWAKRVLGRGAVVLMISDGWEQGDPELLGKQMERLQKTCHRLIWLNPLIATQGFQPETRGLKAALPFVDDFLPVHNLSSLESLARHLESLPARRSARRSGFKT